MPPDGKLDASGSPIVSSPPLNSATARPSPDGCRNESCFSAVTPVMGRNQCVKCVAPFSTAQSFMAVAMVSATDGSSGSPCVTVRRSAR